MNITMAKKQADTIKDGEVPEISASIIDINAIHDSDLHIGQRHFVETKLEHPDGPKDRYGVSCGGRIPYFVEPKKARVFPHGIFADEFASHELIITGPERVSGQAQRFPPARTAHLETDFRGANAKHLSLEEGYDIPHLKITKNRGRLITVTVNGQSFDVNPDRTKSVDLSPVEVKIRKRSTRTKLVDNPFDEGPEKIRATEPGPVESITLTPRLTVRNHGLMDTFGMRGAKLIPLESEDRYAQPTAYPFMRKMERGEASVQEKTLGNIIEGSADKLKGTDDTALVVSRGEV